VKKQIAAGGFSYVFLVKDELGNEYALKRVIVEQKDLKKVCTVDWS
jgi:hypothetical protein